MASRHKELRLMALKFGQVLTLKEVWYVKQTVRKHFLFGIFMSAMKWPWYISIRASITIVSSDILGFKHHCSISFGNDMNMMLRFCMDTMKTGLTCHGFFRYPSSKDLYPKWITKKNFLHTTKSIKLLSNEPVMVYDSTEPVICFIWNAI